MFKEDENKQNKIYQDLATKAAELLKDKQGNLLITVKIKGTGHGFYWSPNKKGLIFVPRDAEYYYIDWKKDDKGRSFLFLPHFLTSGVIICVEPEEIEFLGHN
jgi:hypothetical protein